MLLFPEKDSRISSLVEYLILLTLKKEGKLRGVDIIKKLSEQFKNWKPQSGTIYPVLNRLSEKKGFISLDEKYYKITQTGEKILEHHLNSFINTIIFIDNVFNYGRSLMSELNILQTEQTWLQNHIPFLNSLLDTLPMIRPNLSDDQSSEIFVNLRNIRDLLKDSLQAIEKQIALIKEEEKIVRVKIK